MIMNKDLESDLRKFKSYLNECIISKENAISVKNKELFESNCEARRKHFVFLEKEVVHEEDLCHRMKQTFTALQQINLKEDWNNQIETKRLISDEEKTEALVDSIESKIKDRKHFQELKRERSEKSEYNDDLKEFEKLNEKCKQLEMRKRQEKDALHHIAEERSHMIKELKEECRRQSEERKKLEKFFINADLGISLHETYCKKEELEKLRLEEDILIKEVRERKEIERKKEKAKQEEEKVKNEREDQIRLREILRSEAKAKEREYLQLLTEVMAEESGLASLRSEIGDRKRREHFIVAQMILNERNKRRKENAKAQLLQIKEQKELSELRDSILEEEERRLLLAYVPHLGPFLSPYVIQKLALL